MSDYDTAVREALENLDTWLSDSPDDETRAATKVTRQALAALARLVSERDEWKKLALASQVEISVLRPRVDSTEAEVVSMTQSVQVIQNDRAKLEAEVARLTQGIGMLDDEAESLGREADRLREALLGKCDCGHSHDRDCGCGDCSCELWTCAALAKEGT